MPELGPYGSVRGALSNERPYRDLRNVAANYPFERSHRFAGIPPNSGHRDHSRLSCGIGDTQLGSNGGDPVVTDKPGKPVQITPAKALQILASPPWDTAD
jgi:hypothetical protein